MKKYSVYVLFKTGLDTTFETDSDIRKLKPMFINGAWFIMTENDYVLNIGMIEELIVVKNR